MCKYVCFSAPQRPWFSSLGKGSEFYNPESFTEYACLLISQGSDQQSAKDMLIQERPAAQVSLQEDLMNVNENPYCSEIDKLKLW